MHNTIQSTYRNFTRKPATNLINLIGLAVSLALVVILSVYSYSELATDNYHKNGDRVYLFGDFKGRVYMPAILKDQIDLNIPEVESAISVSGMGDAPVFQAGERDQVTSDIISADAGFFKLFTYEAIEGNLATALNAPMTIVLTQPLAEKLFGNEPALGKTVKMNNDKELTVSAVIREPQANTSLTFSSVTSSATRKIVQPNGEEFTNWGWCNFQLFVLLKEGTKPNEAAKKIRDLFPKNEQDDHSSLQLNPLQDMYFSGMSVFGNYLKFGDKRKVMILLMVAALVLMIALVNFVNISSSQWVEKIKQTGVLKVIGAGNSSLLTNFLAEAFILFLFAFVLAILLVGLLFPIIGGYTGIQFNIQILSNPLFLFLAVAGTFILSLLFSIVPALRISSSKAVDNLKRTVEPGRSNSFLRGILVTAQFVIAIVLIAFTVLVQKQVNFGTSNLGFNQENIVGIKLSPQLNNKKDVLKKQLQEKPGVSQVSFTQYFPGKQMSHWTTNQNIEGENKQFSFDTFNADANFFSITDLQLVQGRFFNEQLATDKNKLVVNETFVREHKLDTPIGTKMAMGFDRKGEGEIIGVIKDFHQKSVNQPIASLVIQNQDHASYALVSLNSKDFNVLHSSIENVKAVASNLSPDFPVEITFFDEAIEYQYRSEIQFRRTFSLFAICAIVICCLGILAMSLFACQRRIKEIGVRKVNGARISEVLVMLNRDFVKWVAIAFVIATPIAYFAMNKWLENFAYKTELSWWIFALSGFLALGIALLTVSWQSWRAATRNPVEALRYE
jgi:putative ABC transport system permease protein